MDRTSAIDEVVDRRIVLQWQWFWLEEGFVSLMSTKWGLVKVLKRG